VNTSRLVCSSALLAALATSGCSAGASTRPEIVLSTHDGSRWVRPDDVDRYVCTDGLLVCQDSFGRTSARLCRCEGR
jgi:hypothetical protein